MSPESLMSGFIRGAIPSPNDSILEKFPHGDASIPAKFENPLVAVMGPAVSGLLVAKNLSDFIAIKEGSQGDFGRG